MTTSRIGRAFGLIAALFSLGAVLAGCAGDPGMIDLHVLYAGDLSLDRAADWKGFLEEHFTRVDTIDVARISDETTAGADVLIFDGSYEVTDNRIFLPDIPALSRDFTRPVIMIGAAAGKTLMQMDLKLDWM
jgi:hypothetical protein